MRRPPSFVISPISTRVASGTQSWTLPGSVLGAFWPPGSLQDDPKSSQDGSKTASRRSRTPPSRLLELLGTLIRSLKSLPEQPRGFRELPGTLRGAICTPSGPLRGSTFASKKSQETSTKGCDDHQCIGAYGHKVIGPSGEGFGGMRGAIECLRRVSQSR